MHESTVMHIAAQALTLAIELGGPILIASLVVGLTISLFQSVTQLQEFTLTFVPKLIVIVLVLLFSGHWMMTQMISFVHSLFSQLPHLLRG
ncbi:MAG: flagellar biosynthesis protein FliQ [Acidimicrobiales bacterium]